MPTERPASMPPGTGTRGGPGPFAALGFFLGAAVLLTWPLAIHLGDRLPAGSHDLWQNYWNLWWWQGSLFERGASPYATDLMYQPGVVSLAFHTHSEANVIPGAILSRLLGTTAAFNLVLLATFIFTGWGAWFLARELTGHATASLVAGIVAAYNAHRIEQSLEHLNLISIQALPVFLVFFLRLLDAGGARNVLATSALYALNALYAWHNGLLVVPFALVLLAGALVRPRRARSAIFLEVAAAGALAVALVLPFAWPMVREILAGATYYLKAPVKKGADALFLLVPSTLHSLWGSAFVDLYARLRSYASAGFTCYLGVPALCLWILGRCLGARGGVAPDGGPRFAWGLWSGLFLLGICLALGDELVAGGHATGLPLPFLALREVPILKTIRVPNRCLMPAMVLLGVLAAQGVRVLLARAAARGTAARRSKILLVVLALVTVDLLAVPYPLQPLQRPAWIDLVRKAPPGTLLDLPGGHRARGAEDLYLQTLHGRPLVGGYASCVPPGVEARVAAYPLLRTFFEGRPGQERQVAGPIHWEAEVPRTLEELGISVVVVHLDRRREVIEALRNAARGTAAERLHDPETGTPDALVERLLQALRSTLGPPVYSDADTEVYLRR